MIVFKLPLQALAVFLVLVLLMISLLFQNPLVSKLKEKKIC